MARRRYVSTDISDDEDVAQVVQKQGYFTALLYTWLIPHADDQRYLPASSPRKLLVIVMPQLALLKGRFRVTPEQVEKAMAEMVKVGLIIEEEDGRYSFPEEAFYRYQTYIPEAKRRSSAFVGVERRSSALSAENAAFPSPSPSPSPSLLPDPSQARAREEEPESPEPESAPPTVLDVLDDALDLVAAKFAHYGHVTAGTVQAIEEDAEDFGIEWLQRAVREAAGASFTDKPPWSYVHSILERWKAQGGPDEPRADNVSQVRRHANRDDPVGAGADVADSWARYARGEG